MSAAEMPTGSTCAAMGTPKLRHYRLRESNRGGVLQLHPGCIVPWTTTGEMLSHVRNSVKTHPGASHKGVRLFKSP